MSTNKYNIRNLPKNTYSLQKEIPKYYLHYCSEKITKTNPNTNGWINIIKTLRSCTFKLPTSLSFMNENHVSDFAYSMQNCENLPLQDYDKSRILQAKLEEHKDIVVKLGDDESIRKEYEYAKKLYKLKGFVKFICYFECNDNFLEYPNEKRNYLCHGEGNQMKIIVMPYFELGSIGGYKWTTENITVLRSCITHALLSYINAFTHGYLHGDFHPGNVLLKTTKQRSIDYLFDRFDQNGEVLNIETNGLRTWIMDFENTREVDDENKKDIMDFYLDIQKFFIILQDYRFIKNINKPTLNPLLQVIGNYMNRLIYPDMSFIILLIQSINNIEVE